MGGSCLAQPVIMLTLGATVSPGDATPVKELLLTPSRLELTPHAQTRTALTFHLASTLSGALTTAAPNNGKPPRLQLPAACAAPDTARAALATPLGGTRFTPAGTRPEIEGGQPGPKGRHTSMLQHEAIHSDMEIRGET